MIPPMAHSERAWNNWYHVVGNTYGTWLRGDPRGWRARHHREHCQGDYKTPPPFGQHAEKYELSKRLMKRQRIILTRTQQLIACHEIVDTLRFHSVEVIDACVTPKHYHILARFRPLAGHEYLPRFHIPGARNDAPISKIRTPRHLVGIAKKQSAKRLTRENLVRSGGIWGVRCKPKPISDRAHQLRVAHYIRRHAAKGAIVWSLTRDDPPPRKE